MLRENEKQQISNPSKATTTLAPVVSEYLILLDDKIHTTKSLKIDFLEESFQKCWILIKNDYRKISVRAFVMLLRLSISYVCELGFSTITIVETEKREITVRTRRKNKRSAVLVSVKLQKNKQSQVSQCILWIYSYL